MLTPGQITREFKDCTKEKALFDAAGERGAGVLTLVLKPTAKGVRASWVARWEAAGQRHKLTLGRYPDMPLRDARAAFEAQVRALLVDGRNPKTTAARHGAATVQALFDAYVAKLKAAGKGWKNPQGVLLTSNPNCADRLGRTRLAADITPGDVVACLKPWFDAGHRRQADIARTAMQAAFNQGIRSANTYTNADRFEWGLKINPAAMVEKDAAASVARERNLSVDELQLLWRSLQGSNSFYPDTADAIRLMMLCGQRVLETLRADGADFDLEAGVWNMPASKTKGGKPHSLPLPASAVPVVRALIARHGQGPLFPARTGAKADRMGITAPNRALQRWCDATGVERFQPRDLRRTWKSRAGEAGVDRFTRDLIQQHAKSDTGSRHYDFSDYLPQMREAMAKWDGWFTSSVKC